MTTKRLSERFAAPFTGGKVDREAGIIRDVLLCGTDSENGRSYPWGNGLTCDAALYEGKHVFDGHQRTENQSAWVGVVRGVRFDARGRPRGDIHMLIAKESARAAMEGVEKFPESLGMSHVVVARTNVRNGREVIESIERVESVDIVLRPATGATFKESRTMPTTLKTFLEAVGARKPAAKKWAAARFIREMDELPMDAMPMDAMPEPPPVDAPPEEIDDGISAAFKTALDAVCADLLANSGDPAKVKELVAKIKKLAHAHGDINGDGKVDAADVDAVDDSDATGEDLEKAESRGRAAGKALVYEAMQTAAAVGLPVDADTLALIEGFPADRITAVAKKLTESKSEKPRTGGRETPKQLSESKDAPTTDAPTMQSVVKAFKRG